MLVRSFVSLVSLVVVDGEGVGVGVEGLCKRTCYTYSSEIFWGCDLT